MTDLFPSGSVALYDNSVFGPVKQTFDNFKIFLLDQDSDGIYPPDDNCPEVNNPGQADGDSDGAGDLCDCAPADGGVKAAPAEVRGLTLTGKATTIISWDDQAAEAGSSTVYDLVSGYLYDLHADSGFASAECFANDLSGSFGTDDRTLIAWDGYYYLVRSHNSCGISSYGPGRDELDTSPPCP